MSNISPPLIDWNEIDTVLLDMDGTLLDKNFDDQFWEHYVPAKYGEKYGLSISDAKERLYNMYSKEAGGYNWTDLDFWAKTLKLDLFSLKYDLAHLIGELPGTIEFLKFLKKMNKEVILVTNSHPKGVALKFTRTEIEPFFTKTSCAHEMKAAKEELIFWQRLGKTLCLNKDKTLFIDDSHRVLTVAKQFGIRHLIIIANPSTSRTPTYSTKFSCVKNVGDLIP